MSELGENRAYECGCNSGSPLTDAVGSLEKELIRFRTVYYLNQSNPVPTAQTHTPRCMQEDQAYIKPRYRTVYIP